MSNPSWVSSRKNKSKRQKQDRTQSKALSALTDGDKFSDTGTRRMVTRRPWIINHWVPLKYQVQLGESPCIILHMKQQKTQRNRGKALEYNPYGKLNSILIHFLQFTTAQFLLILLIFISQTQ